MLEKPSEDSVNGREKDVNTETYAARIAAKDRGESLDRIIDGFISGASGEITKQYMRALRDRSVTREQAHEGIMKLVDEELDEIERKRG